MTTKICTPSQVYLVVSLVLLVLSYFGLSAISQQIRLNQTNNELLQSLNFTYQKDSNTSYVVQILFIVLWLNQSDI